MQQVLKIKTSLSRARVRMEREMKGEVKEEVKEEVKREVNEETNHVVEKMDTSAAAPADLAGTVMEVTKGKKFKVLSITIYF